MAGLHFDITAENKNLLRKLEEIKRGVREAAKQMEESGMSIEQMFDRLTKGAAAFGAGFSAKELVSKILHVRGEMQQLEIAFSTMLQSKAKADKLMSEIVDFAAKTPFDLQGVASGAKQLLAYGSTADEVMKELKMMGDVAAGVSAPIGDLIYLFGTLKAQGRATTIDIRQFAGRGIPIYEELNKILGTTTAELNKMITEGKVGFPEVQRAFENMTSKGGKYFNLMQEQSKSWTGQLSNIGDTITQKLNDLGKEYAGAFEAGIGITGKVVEHLDDLVKIIGILVGAYGAYKAAIIITAAAQKAAIVAGNVKAWFELAKGITTAKDAQIAFNLVTKANPLGLLLGVIAAGVSAFALFRDRTTQAAKASIAFRTEINAEKNKLNEVFDALKNTSAGTEKRREAIQHANQSYGKWLDNLLTEKSTLEEIEKAQRKATKAMIENIAFKGRADYLKQYQEDLTSAQAELYEIVDKVSEKLTTEQKGKFIAYVESGVKKQSSGVRILRDSMAKVIGDYSKIDEYFSGWDAGNFISAVQNVQYANERLKTATDETKEIYDSYLTTLFSPPKKPDNSTISTPDKEIEELRGKIKSLNKEIAGLRSGSVKVEAGKSVQSTIEEKIKELNSAQNALSVLTGISAKEGNDLLKSQQELSRSIIDSDLKLQEMRLSIMEDGRQKRLKQSELEYKQQQAAINKEYQDTVQKYRDQHKPVPNSVKTTYEARLGANNAAKVARDNKIDEDYTKERKEHEAALTAYLLTEEDKRKKAIRERYDAEREWAKKEFEGENMTDAEYTNYLGRINTAEVAEGLQELLDKYQDYTTQRKDIERNFDEEIATLERSRTDRNAAEVDRAIAEAQKKRKEALSGVDLSQFQDSIDWSSVFGDLDAQTTNSLSSLRDKLKNYINKAAKDLKPEDLKVLQDAFKDIDLKVSERRPFRELGKDLEEYKAAQAEVNKAQEDLNYVMSGGEIITGLYMDKTGKMVKKLLTQEEAEKSLTEAQKKRKAAMAAIGNSAAGIAGQIGNVSNAASKIVNVLEEDFGVKVGDNIKGLVEGFNELSDGVSSVVQSAMKGDIAGVIAGVVQSVGGLFKSVTSIFGLGNHKGEEDLKRLEEASSRIVESQKVINSLIEKRIELINKATIAEQKNLAATTEQAIKNQKAYNEQQFKTLQDNWLLAKKGKHNNLTVADLGIGSIEELADFLTGSDRLLALQKQGYGVRDLDKWMEIVNAYQELEESEKKLAENTAKNLTGITLDDARNALDEFLKDADATMEDVAGSFENYMRDAMLGIVKQNTLNKALEDWYNHFEQAMDSNGGLDETEVKNLQREYEDAFTTAQQSYENMLKVANISPESDSSGRQATEKGIASMSQDSANELNGNFSALLIYSNKTAENTSSLRESMNYILEIQRAGWGDVRAIKELTSQMRVHTEKISELSEMIESNTKKAATGIDTLNTKGIYLKK